MSRLLDVHNFVADKLRWQAQVLLDVGLSASAKTVGCLIAHDLNVDKGAAWRAQENMAIALGVSLSTVRRGIAELHTLGHLHVRRSCGRGRTQNYAALIIDGAEAHDSIDRAIAARKAASSEAAEKVAPVTLDGSEKVAPVTSDGPEKVSPVTCGDAEKVSPVTGKGGASERQSLEEPFTPPNPPSRANRVRRDWGEPVRSFAPFPCRAVREAVAGRLGEEGAVSYIDPAAWDGDSRTIVALTSYALDKLQRECGRELKGLGVTVVFDRARHVSLSRQGRPVVAFPTGRAA